MLRKRGERGRETFQLTRVKKLLGSEKMTKADALEKSEQFVLQRLTVHRPVATERQLTFSQTSFAPVVIKILGGKVPSRRNEPTVALEGRDRSDRAKQVSASRSDLTRLFDEVGKCLGFAYQTAPKRELLLQRGTVVFPLSFSLADSWCIFSFMVVAEELERQCRRRTQIPAPQEGARPGGHY
jgi:hypothetical protein